MALKSGRLDPADGINEAINLVQAVLKTGDIAMGAVLMNDTPYALERYDGLWGVPTDSSVHANQSNKSSHPGWKKAPDARVAPYDPSKRNDARTALDVMVIEGKSHVNLNWTQGGGFEAVVPFHFDEMDISLVILFGQFQMSSDSVNRYAGAWLDRSKTVESVKAQPASKVVELMRTKHGELSNVAYSDDGSGVSATLNLGGGNLVVAMTPAEETVFDLHMN